MLLRTLFFVLLFFTLRVHSQKVGVVLSGGGASGIAHIGVLKALDENNIPVDYITGTSIGALVGSLYAIGYSPEQIETMFKSEQFKNWAYGVIDEKYTYYFRRKENNSSWITLKLSLDSAIETSLPTNLISPIPVDFALMELTAPASAASNYTFDSLFIPFRCIASDIEKKKAVVFKNGDLGQAIRASLSYPFYLKPITINGSLLFDGGIYNNFPSDIMMDDFYPDIIIGSNVTANAPAPNEDNLISQLKAMLLTKSNYSTGCENGILIEPKTDVALFDFDSPGPLIDSGYVSTIRAIEKIKSRIERRTNTAELTQRRVAFKQKQKIFEIGAIQIEGLTPNQSYYVKHVLRDRKKTTSIEKLKADYFRLASDDKIKSIYPLANVNPQTGLFDLNFKVKKEKDLFVQVGGNFSNRPISEGFIGAQYNYLSKVALTLTGDAYFGKLYTSAQAKLRIDFPFSFPFYIEPSFTANRFDFFSSQEAFFITTRPAYLIQKDQYAMLDIGIPIFNKGKIVLSGNAAALNYEYYQTDKFTEKDTADHTEFNIGSANIMFEHNTLNRKQYASAGTLFTISTRYINGEEISFPGSTSVNKKRTQNLHQWFIFKLTYDSYLNKRGIVKLGLFFETVYSNQTLFSNYSASILAAQAFQPITECKTIFQPNYRASQYVAEGVKTIFSIRKNIDFRLEAYLFHPFVQIETNAANTASYSKLFPQQYILGTTALVFHSPIGPLSLSVNYYNKEKNEFTFLFHFGYILFNKRAID